MRRSDGCRIRHELRPVPDHMAQLPEPFQGVVFDDGFVEAHGNSRSGHRREELRLKPKSLTESVGCGDSRPCLLQFH